MTDQQRNLFRMPLPKRIELTITQREVLSWLEYSQGQYTVWPRRFQPRMLQKLLGKGLIKIVAYSPARYVLTPLGHAVRSRYADPKKPAREPLVTSMFFKDTDA
jgi:hypothetical protein